MALYGESNIAFQFCDNSSDHHQDSFDKSIYIRNYANSNKNHNNYGQLTSIAVLHMTHTSLEVCSLEDSQRACNASSYQQKVCMTIIEALRG